MIKNMGRQALELLGVQTSHTSHFEKIIAGGGGLIGIGLILLVSYQFVSHTATVMIVASMGATAVLAFAVPHGTLSQPWPIIGGHFVSAIVGVLVARWIPELITAGAAAVALSILAMHYLRCIHPPGGATALSAVIGGSSVHELGLQFAFTPVLLNAVVIVMAAILVNYFFPWRRYPAALLKWKEKDGGAPDSVSPADISYALNSIDHFIDVTDSDLERIYSLAREHASESQLPAEEIRPGSCYSNGRFDDEWSVRVVVDEAEPFQTGEEAIIYKVLAGKGRRQSGTCTRSEFAKWARYEVTLNENSWQRVTGEH
jgi:CBS-domain-containing membrane protein